MTGRTKATSRLEIFSKKLTRGEDLSFTESQELFRSMRNEKNSPVLRSILESWRDKGYTVEEIAGCADLLRREVRRVECGHEIFIDVVGTGGSRAKTFNVSTAAAFVASGAGLPVAKHGNRAASSKTGSADALAELGVDLSADAAAASESLRQHGICFMFAPHFHNLTKEIAEARKAIGRPTIFNLLGPIANPASAPYQLIGVWDGKKASNYGKALLKLGTARTWIVHGLDGLDEITLSGPTLVTAVSNNTIEQFELSPSDFGKPEATVEDLRAGSPKESADTVVGVLDGSKRGKARDLVTINAAAALYVAGLADSLKAGVAIAEDSIESGSALRKLKTLIGGQR